MLVLRRDAQIHAEDGGWFSARWHFSFDRYRDPDNMGVGALRVFNDDRLQPGAIWPMHPHRDVEGITYVVEGTFRHEDSLGNGGMLGPGAIQRMTLGSGALHSEQNGSKTESMRFLQFWILPDTASLPPSVEQRQFDPDADFRNTLRKVLGPEGGNVVTVHQDAAAYVARLEPGAEVSHRFVQDRGGYLYVIKGAAWVAGDKASTGDAAKVFGPHELVVGAIEETLLILVEVPLDFRSVGIWSRGA